ncbi:hypothetical protein ACFQ3S_04395 [Mucilaginibacter terrae]|uniref:hypothetical protein n=1 Tax=Mucilaginibacter terrae TaxID=1955052 RepID=UPI00362F985D
MQFNGLILNICYAIGFCLLGTSGTFAQKNADIAAGVKAPAGIKIDGKHTEWKELPAYNKGTTLRYTLANDANNLYLAITTTDQTNINKLLGGGLTFTINKEGKKKEKDAAVITYPVVTSGGGRARMGGRGRQEGGVDTAALVESRKQAVAGMKELSITGIKEITDTLISIYNTFGVKTAISFDAHGSLFYELAVPLKLLQLNAGSATELAYNLKLNGIQMNFGNREGGGNRQGGGGGGGNGGGGNGGGGGFGGGAMMELMTPTDFWGKYKLAKP